MNNNSNNPIYVMGNEILLEFRDLVSSSIESELLPLFGENWFEECVIEKPTPSVFTAVDLQFLLKEILDRNNGNFRLALAKSIFKTSSLNKVVLDNFDIARKLRNLWAHPTRTLELADLHKLARAVQGCCPPKSPLDEKVNSILRLKVNPIVDEEVAGLTNLHRNYASLMRISVLDESGRTGERERLRSILDEVGSGLEPRYIVGAEALHRHLAMIIENNFLRLSTSLSMIVALAATRDPTTGNRFISVSRLQEINDSLDAEQKYVELWEGIKGISDTWGPKNCACEYCQSWQSDEFRMGCNTNELLIMQLFDRMQKSENPDDLLLESGGLGYDDMGKSEILFHSVAMAMGADPFKLNWNFDILNWDSLLLREMDWDEDITPITEYAVKLLAIRNGIPASELSEWVFE